MIKEISVPDIGNFSNVEIIEIAVSEGTVVKKEDSLITLETEKAAMDVPSPVNGKIQTLKVKVGDKVSKGSLIALIDVEEEQNQSAQQSLQTQTEAPKILEKEQQSAAKVSSVEETEPALNDGGVHAGPATRRLARELGVDLTCLQGSGKNQRIITADIHAYVKSKLQEGGASQFAIEKAPDIDFSQFGEIEIKPLGRIKKWTGKTLHRNWVTIPHVTQFDEADITELEEFRQENKQAAEDNGIKLTPLAFIMKATASALKAFPQFNSSLAANGSDLIFKKFYHIGVAVDTPNGLLVPVVRDVDSKGLFDIARELSQLSKHAVDGKLKAEQMQGSCFSISSLGGIGGTAFTPIINAPDVAILGVSKAQIKPIYKNDIFIPRRMLPLSLSYDHRVIDGAEAAKFITHISLQLQDIRKLLL